MLCAEGGVLQDSNKTMKTFFPDFELTVGETTIIDFLGYLRERVSEYEPENLFSPDHSITEGQFVIGDGENKKKFKFGVHYLENRKNYSVTISDVTEYFYLLDEVEQANRAKSRFLATMSHEIRTPMNAIIGISQMQMVREDLPPDCIDAIGKIYASGNGLLGIINDILDLSKIETGKFEIIPAEYDLPSLINDTIQLNISRIGSKPIDFRLNIPENIPAALLGDEMRIKQIINNILSNAIKYTDKGTVAMSVNSKNSEIGIDLIISVADTGQGIKTEDLEKLGAEFSRFNLDENRTTEGTGLGMNITKRLLALMNGKMEIRSKFGEGSTFIVTIPQEKVSEKTIGEKLAASLSDCTYSRVKQAEKMQIVRELMNYGKVLVVDDVETNLYVAEGLLRPYGIAVTTVTSGFEAIDLIKQGKTYDIIFMDHMMPKMDGIEAVKNIRSMNYNAPIIALTANAIVGNDEMFKTNGFDDFISKPIDIRQLNAALNRFVRRGAPAGGSRGSLSEPLQNLRADFKNNESVPEKLIEVFLRDSQKSIPILTKLGTDDLVTFTITAHAMKSALANVGNAELSELAKSLEAAGRAGDTAFIEEKTPGFIENLNAFILKITPENDKKLLPEDNELLGKTLSEIAAACENYDADSANEILLSLRGYKWSDDVFRMIDEISKLILHGEFEEASEACRKKNLFGE
jgi:signal transduction histidine kinase/DNA-binding response OmpR family regulator